MWHKKIFVIFSVGTLVLLGALPVFAGDENVIAPFQNTPDMGSPVTDVRQVLGQSGLLANVVRWTYTIFFIIAVLFILLAAYNYLQGGTNPEKVKLAKGQLKYAVIAIVVALLASGIALMINTFLATRGQ